MPLAEVLKTAFARHGKPEALRCDNGPEFTSWSLRLFLEDQSVR